MSAKAVEVFSAAPRDLARVEAILDEAGIRVSSASLAARIDDDDQGILLCRDATLSWTLDGGALYLYDIVPGSAGELDALLATALRLARARFAAVLVVTCFEDSPLVAGLCDREFFIDSREPETRAGHIFDLLTLIRQA